MELIREEILPYASTTPSDFIVSIMVLLNKGSIESASGGDSGENITFGSGNLIKSSNIGNEY